MKNSLSTIASEIVALSAEFIDGQIEIQSPHTKTKKIVVGMDQNTIVTSVIIKDTYTVIWEIIDGLENDITIAMRLDVIITDHLIDTP